MIEHDDLQRIAAHIEAGLAERAPHERLWAAMSREYSGDLGIEDHPSVAQVIDPDDRPWINYVLSMVNTILPALLAHDPALRALPRTPEQARMARGADRTRG